MSEFVSWFDTAADLTTILMGLMAVAALWLVRDAARRPRGFYTALFCVMICWAALYWGSELLRAKGALAAAGYMNLAVRVCAALFVPLLAEYVLLLCGEGFRSSRLLIAEGVLCLAQFALSACNLIVYGPVGEFESENLVNPFAILSLAVLAASYVLLAVLLFSRRKKLKTRDFVLLLLSLFGAFFLNLLLFELMLVLDMAERYFRQKEDLVRQKEENLRQREELVRQRVNLAVLQMRPHLIYNTLMSIYYLCEQDPEKAQRVTLDFARYLQKNFTAVVREGTVPFSEELEHTRAYLAVEQARYAESLSVAVDTPETYFKLPPLTLQPIVENAVKHGLREDTVLRVSVTTEARPGGFAVIVEDTGPGFAPADAVKPHTTLENIR